MRATMRSLGPTSASSIAPSRAAQRTNRPCRRSTSSSAPTSASFMSGPTASASSSLRTAAKRACARPTALPSTRTTTSVSPRMLLQDRVLTLTCKESHARVRVCSHYKRGFVFSLRFAQGYRQGVSRARREGREEGETVATGEGAHNRGTIGTGGQRCRVWVKRDANRLRHVAAYGCIGYSSKHEPNLVFHWSARSPVQRIARQASSILSMSLICLRQHFCTPTE